MYNQYVLSMQCMSQGHIMSNVSFVNQSQQGAKSCEILSVILAIHRVAKRH